MATVDPTSPLYNLIQQNSIDSTETSNQSDITGKNEFLQLLVTQLKNQDPLDPVKNQDFVAQLAQFNSLEQMINLNSNFEKMLSLQQMTQASCLIGATVTWQDADGNQMSGVVSQIAMIDQQANLVVGTNNVTLDQVLSISPTQE